MNFNPRRVEAAVYGRAEVPLLTPAEAAAADLAARERHGVPERVLMENAGRAAALVLERLYPTGRVVGVAGSGNNGGDLLVMLRTLRSWGREVSVVAAGSKPPDPALAHGVELPVITEEESGCARLAAADVVVDGLLGTGARGAPRGAAAEWIEWMNATSRPIVALDLPSGVDAESGAVAAHAVQAELTITFGWPKIGLLLQPARQRCGRLLAVDIAFPPVSVEPRAWAITPGMVRARLRARAPDAHKGTAGRLLIVAGSTGMAGAAAIAAAAAGRAGGGLLRLASTADNREILQTLAPEATFLDRAQLAYDDVEPMHAFVVGPGLGTDAGAVAALDRVLELLGEQPLLLDADALNILARTPDRLHSLGSAGPVVITPHARELARLTGRELEDILADAPGAARAAAERFSCAVLLKGQPSLVAAPDGRLWVNTVGSSDTASAGMGDQLAGTVGALLAGGADPLDAAAVGLFLSGRAADLAARGRSLVPADVTARLHAALADPGPRRPPVGLPFVTFDQPPRW